MQNIISVIFVCLGNINRSAIAEALLRLHAPNIKVKSAGTGGHFTSLSASQGMISAAKKKNIDLSYHRAKQIVQNDFEEFDLIIAMDSDNFEDLLSIAPKNRTHKLKLFLPTYAPQLNLQDTPDPYYEGNYSETIEIVEEGIKGLITKENLSIPHSKLQYFQIMKEINYTGYLFKTHQYRRITF